MCVKKSLRMCSRAASLLEHEGDVGWLTGPAPCNAYHHMMHRLFNIFVTREETRLETEIVEKEKMTSEHEKTRLNPNARPFAPRGIPMRTTKLDTDKERQINIQSIAEEWVTMHKRKKNTAKQQPLNVQTKNQNHARKNRFSILAEDEDEGEHKPEPEASPVSTARKEEAIKAKYDVNEIPVDVLDELIKGHMEKKNERNNLEDKMIESEEQREINGMEVDVSRSSHNSELKKVKERNEKLNALIASYASILEQKKSNEEELLSEAHHMEKKLGKVKAECEETIGKLKLKHEEHMKKMDEKWKQEVMIHGSKEEWCNEIEVHKKKLERTEKALKEKTETLIKHLNRDKVERVKKVKRPVGCKARTTF